MIAGRQFRQTRAGYHAALQKAKAAVAEPSRVGSGFRGFALGDGSGFADLTVKELRFDDHFQPDMLTPLALGVVANVQGSVVGDGRID